MSSRSVIPSGRYDAAGEKNANAIGRRLAAARKQHGYSLEDVASALASFGIHLTRRAVGKWESGDSVPNAYQMVAMSLILDLRCFTELAADCEPALNEEGLRRLDQYRDDLIASGRYAPARARDDLVEMPFSLLSASAGRGEYLTEEYFETRSFPRSEVPLSADFGLQVSGDSMEPLIHDGQIIWIRRCRELMPGEIGLFILNGQGYVKQLGEEMPASPDGWPRRYLISLNPKYDPIEITGDSDCRLAGRVL